MNYLREIKNVWQDRLLNKNFRLRFFLSLITLGIILVRLSKFLCYNETRPGFSFTDPILSLFQPIDVTWFTFGLIYLALIIALVSLSFSPEKFLIAIQSYSFIALFRLTTIYMLPLNPPQTIIPLDDPFIEFFGNGDTLLRDLFFSGHTSTMFLLFLTSTNIKLRPVFLTCTILVAAAVLIQHVHYTVDVVAAPFFAYTSYRLALLINKQG